MEGGDTAHHAKSFSKFIESSSGITSDRHSNSSRTKKAREKLLKLSTEQFCELSTDVFDELDRRSNRAEEKYLPENGKFHPKRNEARKKLATLPSTRFKDLVTDMLYDIKRRGLDEVKEEDHSTAHIGVQAGTVIPTKSTLAWSSDEEEEEQDGGIRSLGKKQVKRNKSTTASRDQKKNLYKLNNSSDEFMQSELNSKYSPNTSPQSLDEEKPRLINASNNLAPAAKLTNAKTASIMSKSQSTYQEPENNDNTKDREIELLISEGNKMDQTITLHEKTISSLKMEIKQLQEKNKEISKAQESSLGQIYSLERDLSGKDELIRQLESRQQEKSVNDNSKVSELEQELSKLKFAVKNFETEKQFSENAYLDLKDKNEKLEREYKNILDDYKILQEKHNSSLLMIDEMRDELKEERAKNGNKTRKLEDEKKALVEKLEVVKAQLEQQKRSHPAPLTKALSDNLNSIESMSKIEMIESRLEKVSHNKVNNSDETIEGLKVQILDWQKKYQDLRSEQVKVNATRDLTNQSASALSIKQADLSENAVEKFIDDEGFIPIKSVVELNSLISSFLLIINDENLSTDLLFETITKITIAAGNIASEGEPIGNGEFSALIKASVSHAITSTRFYAVHGKTLPKLVVETAISEISFSVCNLIASAKVTKRDRPIGFGPYGTPSSVPKPTASESSILDDIPNRPLRIAKKNGQSQSPIITSKRENPFTANFSLSPISKPASKFGNNISGGSSVFSNNLPNTSDPDLYGLGVVTNVNGNDGNSAIGAGNGDRSLERSVAENETNAIASNLNKNGSSTSLSNGIGFKSFKSVAGAAVAAMTGAAAAVTASAKDKKEKKKPAAESEAPVFPVSGNFSVTEKVNSQDIKSKNENIQPRGLNLRNFEAKKLDMERTRKKQDLREVNIDNNDNNDSATNVDKVTEKKLNKIRTSSVSSLKAKFDTDKANTSSNAYEVNDSRSVTPTGNILSRVKQLESNSNGGSPNSSPFASPKFVKPSPEKILNKFETPKNDNFSEELLSDFKSELKENKAKNVTTKGDELSEPKVVKRNIEKRSIEKEPYVILGNQNSNGLESRDNINGSSSRFGSRDNVNEKYTNNGDGFGLRDNVNEATTNSNKFGSREYVNEVTTNNNDIFGSRNNVDEVITNNSIRFGSRENVNEVITNNSDRFGSRENVNEVLTNNSNKFGSRDNINEVYTTKSDRFGSRDNVNEANNYSFGSRDNVSEQPKPKDAFKSAATDKAAEVGKQKISFNENSNFYSSRNNSSVSVDHNFVAQNERQQSNAISHDRLNAVNATTQKSVIPNSEFLNSTTSIASSASNLTNKSTSDFMGPPTALGENKENYHAGNSNNNSNYPSPLPESKKQERTADFDVNTFDIADPDNTLGELLLYLEHQTVEVISTIQTLLSAIKTPDSTTGTLKEGAKAIGEVVGQMFDATSLSMAQSRNVQLREHGRWVVQSLSDCGRRMTMLCVNDKSDDDEYADKHFKQRLAGIAFDIAKCTKELVKTVEEASIKEEIAVIDARLGNGRA